MVWHLAQGLCGCCGSPSADVGGGLLQAAQAWVRVAVSGEVELEAGAGNGGG